MKFHFTPLEGARLELEKRCEREFTANCLETRFVQLNNALATSTGTLRGLDYQLPAAEEAKVIGCVRGALWDAVIDSRLDSPTFKKWFGAKLPAENRLVVYVPRGFAHAVLMLLVSAFYGPEQERGMRRSDAAFRIEWPIAERGRRLHGKVAIVPSCRFVTRPFLDIVRHRDFEVLRISARRSTDHRSFDFDIAGAVAKIPTIFMRYWKQWASGASKVWC